MKAKFLTILLSVLLLSAGAFAQSISLETVDGLYSTDTLTADGSTMINFNMRVTSDDSIYTGITNGFRVYSGDGAAWTTTSLDTLTSGWKGWFQIYNLFTTNTDGTGADTVAFGGVSLIPGVGMPANYDQVAYQVTIGPIDASHHGKEICLDSSWYPTSGTWKWGGGGGYSVFPAWSGPHCYTVVDPVVLDVNDVEGAGLPLTFALRQNYPNPFNPTTTINFDVPRKADVNLSIYNVLGQKVKTLVDEPLDAGVKVVEWDGTNDAGTSVASGIYFYRLEADDFTSTKKMMMLK